MSIVIVGITPEYVITMSDGRVVGQNGKILNESFKKIYRFNPYICVGITGCMDFFQELFTKIDKISLNRNEARTDQLIQTIYELSKEIKLNDSISGNSSIVVCGINTYNKIESIGFSTKNFVIYKQNSEKISDVKKRTTSISSINITYFAVEMTYFVIFCKLLCCIMFSDYKL